MDTDRATIDVCAGDHVVLLYEGDLELVRAVCPYLAAALRAGETAVAIATPAHRRAFEDALTDAGIELERAAADGAWVALDAQQTLSTFADGSGLDRQACEAALGGLLTQAAARGRPLRLYGEMVSLLWERGEVLSAIELERVWNALAQRHDFSLFCAYRRSLVSTPDDADALRAVCGLHSSVLGSAPRSWPAIAGGSGQHGPCARAHTRTAAFDADRDAPHRARSFLLDALTDWDQQALADDAVTVVGELAANAVLHVGLPFDVTVRLERRRLRIEVRDASVAVQRLMPRSVMSGLRIVAAICSRWGVDPCREGKVVWAELAAAA